MLAPLPMLCRDCRSVGTAPPGSLCGVCGSRRTIAHSELLALTIAAPASAKGRCDSGNPS